MTTYLPTSRGSIRLFRLAGITVYVHWSWLIVVAIAYGRRGEFSTPLWNLAEYVMLFAIVLMHEFGHALACRSVGGIANQIVLWPLGGVAYVQPPPRPGAFLWSIAAGPLVNVLLVPITGLIWWLCPSGQEDALGKFVVPDITKFCQAVAVTNLVLLIFNVLPIYPLDGGQILQSLLWFVLSRGTSIVVASVIGIAGGLGIAGLALLVLGGQWWGAMMGVFIVLQAWSGLQYGLALRRRERLPRHMHVACPNCGKAPFQGPHWQCGECGTFFDLFAQGGACPGCDSRFGETTCLECRSTQPIAKWYERGAEQAPNRQ